MSTDIPDWVRLDCRAWGHQKRRAWSGTPGWYLTASGEKCRHIDGYAQSLLGRIRDEREGAGQGIATQKWPEVFWGGGLEVQRAITGMPERPHAVLHLHYVWDPEWNMTARRKARLLELNVDVYYDHLDRAEMWLWARLESRDTQAHEAVHKIVREALRKGVGTATKAHPGESLPTRGIDFSPLHRQKISLAR